MKLPCAIRLLHGILLALHSSPCFWQNEPGRDHNGYEAHDAYPACQAYERGSAPLMRARCRAWLGRAKLPGSSSKEGGSMTLSRAAVCFPRQGRSSQPQGAKRPIRKAVA